MLVDGTKPHINCKSSVRIAGMTGTAVMGDRNGNGVIEWNYILIHGSSIKRKILDDYFSPCCRIVLTIFHYSEKICQA